MRTISVLITEGKNAVVNRLVTELKNLGFQSVFEIPAIHRVADIIRKGQPLLIFVGIQLACANDSAAILNTLVKSNDVSIIFIANPANTDVFRLPPEVENAYLISESFTRDALKTAVDYACTDKAGRGGNMMVLKDDFDSIFLRKNGEYEKVLIGDILWIKASGASLEIVSKSGSKYVLSLNLSQFLAGYPHPDLVRVQRSYIVNVEHIQKVRGRQLIIDGMAIPYSDAYVSDIDKLLCIVRR